MLAYLRYPVGGVDLSIVVSLSLVRFLYLGGIKVKPRTHVLIGLACLTGAATVVTATTVRRMDMAELVARSKLVVHGTVVDNQVVYDDGPNGPANVRTITTIEVMESLKGEAGATVTVAGFGGQVGDLIYQWPGVPKFEIGEETIVMLSEPAPDLPNMRSLFAPLGRDGSLMVTGLEQGRFKINQDPDLGKVVVRSEDGLEFVGGAKVDVQKQPRLLDDVLTDISSIVATQRVDTNDAQRKGGDK